MFVTESDFDFQIQDTDGLNCAALTFQAQPTRKHRHQLNSEVMSAVVYATTRGFAAERRAAAFWSY